MRIKNIKIENFKGIDDFSHDFDSKVTIITGNCGTGKSSLLKALTFPLNNILPENAIKDGSLQAKITEVCENTSPSDLLTIEKIIERPKKVTTFISGNKVTSTMSNNFLQGETNVDANLMKIVTSSDVLANLKPNDFASIFLTESVERKTFNDLIKIANEQQTTERKKINLYDEDDPRNDELPEDVINCFNDFFEGKSFNLESIDKACSEAKEKRKLVNSECKGLEVLSKEFLKSTKPGYDAVNLQKQFEEIIGLEKNIDSYKGKVKAYNTAVNLKLDNEKRIAVYEKEIAESKAIEPDENTLKELDSLIKAKNKEVSNLSAINRNLLNTKAQTQKIIENLNKPICPISEKICCTTDKSSLKNELLNNIKNADESIKLTNENIDSINKEIDALNVKIKEYYNNKEAWSKKLMKIKEVERLKNVKIEIPEKPVEISLVDYSTQKVEINEKLKKIKEFETLEESHNKFLIKKREYIVLNFIVKSLDIKGPVIAEFIETLIDPIEDLCNQRAETLKTGMNVKLIANDGLLMLFKPSDDRPFLPYVSLSSGEKLLALVLMTDLINIFSGSGFLIIDDIDHLDENNFRTLMDFVTDPEIQEQYDNIIISSVNHTDILDVINQYKWDFDIDHIIMS